MKTRQYIESDLEAVLSSWESATRLAHPFMTDEFLEEKLHEPTGQQVLRLRYAAENTVG
jgi:hypothetical protein